MYMYLLCVCVHFPSHWDLQGQRVWPNQFKSCAIRFIWSFWKKTKNGYSQIYAFLTPSFRCNESASSVLQDDLHIDLAYVVGTKSVQDCEKKCESKMKLSTMLEVQIDVWSDILGLLDLQAMHARYSTPANTRLPAKILRNAVKIKVTKRSKPGLNRDTARMMLGCFLWTLTTYSQSNVITCPRSLSYSVNLKLFFHSTNQRSSNPSWAQPFWLLTVSSVYR